jgi:hypothetical protein
VRAAAAFLEELRSLPRVQPAVHPAALFSTQLPRSATSAPQGGAAAYDAGLVETLGRFNRGYWRRPEARTQHIVGHALTRSSRVVTREAVP